MSIRFTCNACHTVLKVGEMITEKRKVRCTGCGLVIVVMPDPNDPTGVITTIPQKTSKPNRPITLTRRQLGLVAALGVALLALGLITHWVITPPSDRGSVEGEVKLDEKAMEKGTITFEPTEAGKGFGATAPITDGRYRIPAKKGPSIGMHKVKISNPKGTGRQILKPGSEAGEKIDEIVDEVHERFNTKTELPPVEVKIGANTAHFAVTSGPK